MDINLLGIQHFNQTNNPFSPAMTPPLNSGGGNFEDILRRVQSTGQTLGAVRQDTNPDGSAVPRNQNLPAIVRDPELYELCLELETILIKNMIRGMRNTIQKTDLIDTGFAGEIYEDMLWDEYAKVFTRSARLGFAEMAYRDLSGRR